MKARIPSCRIGLGLVLGFQLVVSVPRLSGQATTGAIVGTVADSSGSVIPEAEVTITNTATNQARVSKTDSAGYYDIEALIPGTYDVMIKKEGFSTHITHDVKVDPSARVAANVVLAVGSTVTKVSVTASAVRVETESGASGGVVSGGEVNQLLLNGRNYVQLSVLVPGVVSTSGLTEAVSGGLTYSTNISVNGGDPQLNNTSIDGTYNMNTGAFASLNVVTPLDSISEFTILKSNYNAKYGVSGSGQIQVETKSGTRDFHGSAYDYVRNQALYASNFFSGGSKTPLNQNNFGFSIGGPLYIPGKYNTSKTKTFFFVNEEWHIRHAGDTIRGAMFTQAMRSGDFTQSPTLRAGGLQFDSTATALLARAHPGVNCLPSANTLNPACFDPNSVLLMNKFWPLPNNPSGGFLNYINPGVEKFNQRDDNYRVDQFINDRNRIMARFSYEPVTDAFPAATWGVNPAPTTTQDINQTGYNALMRYTANISASTVNELTWSGTHDKPRLEILNAGPPSGLAINYPFPAATQIPGRMLAPTVLMAGGWAGLNGTSGYASFPEHASDGAQTISDDVSMVKGLHTLQFGGEYIWGIKRQDGFAASQGGYSFSGVHSNDPAADYLLGLDSTFTQANHVPRHYDRWKQYEFYFQDDWKVRRRLTLNLGLRYVYARPTVIQGDIFSDFDPPTWVAANAPVVQPDGVLLTGSGGVPITATGNPADLLNGIVFPGTSRHGKPAVLNTIIRGWKGNFQPRVGFAWDVFGDGKTAVRGGYGMGSSQLQYYATEQDITNPPWVQTVNLLNGTMTDPSLGTPGAITTQALNTAGQPGAVRKPVIVQSWSLTVDREVVRNGVMSVAYVGSHGTQLGGATDINFPEPVSGPSVPGLNCLQPGQIIASTGFQFDPCVNLGLVSADYTRPYKGYSSITSFRGAADYRGRSFYDSLQTGFKYRPGNGKLTLTVAYTWSKTLQDTGVVNGTAQNSRDWKAEYGPAPQDLTQVFTSSYVYQLPILRNKSGFVATAFGNWQFSGITAFFSGAPLTPTLATGTGGLATRPNCIGPIGGPKTLTEWFNTSAYAAPAFGFFGNCANGIIRGPGEQDWNWALFKTFPVGERARFQFRAEFFNIWNHPNFSGVSTAYGSGNFGQVTSAQAGRTIEFALRLDF